MKKNQHGFSAVTGLIVVAVVGLIGFAGWYVWQSKQENDKSVSTAQDQQQANKNAYLEIKEWGVRFPQTSSGKYSVKLTDVSPSTTYGGPADLESQPLQVIGFSKEENKCTLPFDAGNVYRHKDQNPVIQYQGTHNLDPVAQMKIGEWWYSINGLAGSGNCFEGINVSNEYKTFTSKFLEDFKQLQTIN